MSRQLIILALVVPTYDFKSYGSDPELAAFWQFLLSRLRSWLDIV